MSRTPARSSPEKIDYLLALHAQLLGEHHPGQDSYGLTDLESNLLGLAIAEVYERCALTGEEPRELLLQEELERRYQLERDEGSAGIAEALRNLSMRLNNYVGDGPYAYLDRPPDDDPARRAADRVRHPERPGGEGRGGAVRAVRARQAQDRAHPRRVSRR